MPVDQDGRTLITRLIVSRDDLPKVVGIAGQIMTAIRDKTGGLVKAEDLPNSTEEKMIVLGGTLRQVIGAFDLVTEVITNIICYIHL
jgi:hypothetical protein